MQQRLFKAQPHTPQNNNRVPIIYRYIKYYKEPFKLTKSTPAMQFPLICNLLTSNIENIINHKTKPSKTNMNESQIPMSKQSIKK